MKTQYRLTHKTIDNIEHKYCSQCTTWKILGEFAKSSERWDGLRSQCKNCRKSSRNIQQETAYYQREDIKEKKKNYDILYNSQSEVKVRKSQQFKENYIIRTTKRELRISEVDGVILKECQKCNQKLLLTDFHQSMDNVRGQNRQDICIKCVKLTGSLLENKLKRYAYIKKRRSIPTNRVNHNFGRLMYASIKSNKQGYHWETIVGYTLNDLRSHLERKFQLDMTWENYGRNGWHIDHIIPIKFKLPNDQYYWNQEELQDIMSKTFQRCWSLDNLQPLWEHANISKSNRFEG